jgi:hypothetical protein
MVTAVRLKLIACKVLCREISRICAESENYIDVTYLRQGYHNEPAKLREALQREIDRVDSGNDAHTCAVDERDFDAVLLGFGLCSNGTAGVSSQKYPLVMPRAHDCITLLLGSADRYRKIFDECSGGVYWYSCGWIENCPMPCQKTEQMNFERYKEKYGADNASYLVGSDNMTLRSYHRAAFIDTGVKTRECAEITREAAEYYGWEYKQYQGSQKLLTDFLGGNWDNERFLKLPPRCFASPSYDGAIVKAEKPHKG